MPCPVSITLSSHDVLGGADAHVDAPAGRREFHGVGQQVRDHLLQAVGIAVHFRVRAAELRAQIELLGRRRGARRIHGSARDCGQLASCAA